MKMDIANTSNHQPTLKVRSFDTWFHGFATFKEGKHTTLFVNSINLFYLFIRLFVCLSMCFSLLIHLLQAACIGWDVLKRIPKQITKRKSIGILKWIQI